MAMTRSSSRAGSGAADSDDCAVAPAGAAKKKTTMGTKARFRIARKRTEAPPDRLTDWIRRPTLLLYANRGPNDADHDECDTSRVRLAFREPSALSLSAGPLLGKLFPPGWNHPFLRVQPINWPKCLPECLSIIRKQLPRAVSRLNLFCGLSVSASPKG